MHDGLLNSKFSAAELMHGRAARSEELQQSWQRLGRGRVARTPHYDGVKKGANEPAVIALFGIICLNEQQAWHLPA